MEFITLPSNFKPSYGASGCRGKAELLHSCMQRCGILMALRSIQMNKMTGIMITASHNPEHDNGIKLLDWNGEMIEDDLEKLADEFVKINETTQINEFVERVVKELNISKDMFCKARVMIGHDTRESAKELLESCKSGVMFIGGYGSVYERGLVTSPELSMYVNFWNVRYIIDYCYELTACFTELLETLNFDTTSSQTFKVYVDCANGVGALKLEKIAEDLAEFNINMILFNTGEGTLNFECGSDYVEKNQKFPSNMPDTFQDMDVCFSIDGDADRVVCFTQKNGACVLLNGDKIAVLFATFIEKHIKNGTSLNCGIVQTAYSNGASTKYIQKNLEMFSQGVRCTYTGVKHLHKVAKEFDIGVYFEANGHGTVLFHKYNTNKSFDNDTIDWLKQLVSQNTGDAIGNILAIIAILCSKEITFDNWINMYNDLNVCQTHMHVDRSLFETSDADRICVKPFGLQENIDKIIKKYDDDTMRAFVRPSGTEDIVRIYVEGKSLKDTHNVACEIKTTTIEICHS